MQQHHHPVDASGVMTGPVGAELRARLAPSENVLAELEVDLSDTLRFEPGLLLLTNARLMAQDAHGAQQEWPLESGMALRLIDHAGVGTLELQGGSRRLALWRFTLGAHTAALRLVQAFERQLARVALPAGSAAGLQEEEETLCQDCGAPLAMASSPTLRSAEEPRAMGVSPCASTLMTARSDTGSVPTTVAA